MELLKGVGVVIVQRENRDHVKRNISSLRQRELDLLAESQDLVFQMKYLMKLHTISEMVKLILVYTYIHTLHMACKCLYF